MAMANNLILTVLVNLLLIVLAQDYNPRKIVGTWNVLAIVHTLPKNTPAGERCTRFTYEHLIDNVYRLTRDRVLLNGKHERTVNMMTIIGSKVVIVPQPNCEAPVQTILDYEFDQELVLFCYGTYQYFLLSRDVCVSSDLLKKYEDYSALEWNMTPIDHHNCNAPLPR